MLLQEQLNSLQGEQQNGGIPVTAEVAVTEQVTAAKNSVEYMQGGQFPPGTAPKSSGTGKLSTILILVVLFLIVWWLSNLSMRKFEGA
jgi:hypothetical protein